METIEICIFETAFLIYKTRLEQQELSKRWHNLKYQLYLGENRKIPRNTYAKLFQKYIKKIKLHA